MSGIFGFSHKGREDMQRMLHALDVWNQSYGREGSEKSLSKQQGMGCHMEHLSECYPCKELILSENSKKAVVDAVLYNREEICRMLTIKNMDSVSDEELLLRLITEKGYASLSSVNGDFAGAIYDEKEKTWTLFRDHMGVRPLFYYIDQKTFAFSTDMRGLAAMPGADMRLNEEKFYLHMAGYSDLSLCETEYANIHCVSPASWMVVQEDGKGFFEEKHIYWRLCQRKIRLGSDGEYQAELRRLITDAVKRRLDAVTGLIGAELSGGLDSSVVAILIQRLGREGRYFSWSYSLEDLPLQEEDERRIILDICAREGISCQFSEMPKKVWKTEIDEILKPVLPAYINTLNLSEGSAWLRSQGARVVFTGHGGDEGVSHRCNLYELWYYHEYFDFIRAIYRQTEGKGLRPLRTLKQAARQLFIANPAFRKPFYSPRNAAAYLSESFKRRMERTAKRPLLYFAYDPAAYVMQGGSRMRMDNAALQGAENGVRYMLPFLDYRVIDFALSIPRSQYQNGRGNRWIYRKAFEDILPKSLQELYSKETLSMRDYQLTGVDVRGHVLESIELVQKHLDREYWAAYLDFDAIEGLTLSEEYTMDEFDRVSSVLNELLYCAMLQRTAKKSGEWCDKYE